jgi:hypothetical protein
VETDSLSLLFKMHLVGKSWCSWNKCVKNWSTITNQCQNINNNESSVNVNDVLYIPDLKVPETTLHAVLTDLYKVPV